MLKSLLLSRLTVRASLSTPRRSMLSTVGNVMAPVLVGCSWEELTASSEMASLSPIGINELIP